jgi:CheY-like chemotaxis protein
MRILAVEDEPEYLEMLQEVMSGLGHSLTIAANGFEALNTLDRQQVDVIISDVKMPVMDGLELHRLVRQKPTYTNTPFVFLTGVDDLSNVKSVCKEDCDLLLKKPFPVDSLLRWLSGSMGL